MIHLTHITAAGERQDFSLPMPLKDLLDKPPPSFWTQERLAVEFQMPSAPLNESVVPPKEFHRGYDESAVNEMLRCEFESHVERQW